MLKRLKRKFILINMLCVSIVLCIVLISISYTTYKIERNDIIRGLEFTVSGFMNKDHGATNDNPTADNIFDDKFNFPTITAVINADGVVNGIYENDMPASPTEPVLNIFEDILGSDKSEGILRKHLIIFCKRTDGNITVASMTPLKTLTDTLNMSIIIAALSLSGCLFLLFAVSYMLAGIAMKPAIEAWDAQKQFVADASHDLKTPLTVILANTEIIKGRKNESVESVTKWLDSTKEESERMRRLIDSMLELAKSEDHSDNLPLIDTNISEIVEACILQMETVAFENGVTIDSRIANDLIVKGDPDTFSRLVHILVDNGIKYTSSDSMLKVKLMREWRSVKLSIRSNSVIGKDEMPHIFERFYRGDKTRQSSGFGLGLSIAKNLTEKMGGEIKCESREGFGTEFTVEFPIELARVFPNRKHKT